jgi:hypothetical protein
MRTTAIYTTVIVNFLDSDLAEVSVGSIRTMQPTSETNKSGVLKYRRRIQSGEKLNPLVVVRNSSTGNYHLMDGHHRLAAMKAEGLSKVPVKVHTTVKNSAEAGRYYRATRHGG